jgi:Fe-S cluster assembly ATP-binding protein
MLQLKDLTVSAGRKIILEDINFTFEKGKTYAVMGPNGSGKSTLAYAIMGHPSYQLHKTSQIVFGKKRIDTLPADKRAQLGIFLSFQSPLSLSGITVFQMLRLALSGKVDPLVIRERLDTLAKELKIKEELLNRSLNENTSGGEKKKLEILQAAVLNPQCVIFDEVDTGVDIDALKIIAKFINSHKKNKTYIIITHYNRILKYLKPDKVLVMVGGKLVKTGDYKLAHTIEKEGYEQFSK